MTQGTLRVTLNVNNNPAYTPKKCATARPPVPMPAPKTKRPAHARKPTGSALPLAAGLGLWFWVWGFCIRGGGGVVGGARGFKQVAGRRGLSLGI